MNVDKILASIPAMTVLERARLRGNANRMLNAPERDKRTAAAKMLAALAAAAEAAKETDARPDASER